MTGPNHHTDVEPSELDSLVAETKAEERYPDGTVAVPLAGTTVRILPPTEWTSSAQEDLSGGRFNSWAEDSLAGDDYADVWMELNNGRGPKMGEIQAMFEAWTELSGQDRGKQLALRRSLRSMPPR